MKKQYRKNESNPPLQVEGQDEEIEVIELESSESDTQEMSSEVDIENTAHDDNCSTNNTPLFSELEFDSTFDKTQVQPLVSGLKEYEPGIQYRKYSSSSILVTMKPGLDLYFTGKAQVQVLKGTLSIYGSLITEHVPRRQLFSPQGHSLLCIRSISDQAQCQNPAQKEEPRKPEFLETDPPPSTQIICQQELDTDFNGVSVMILEAFENSWSHGFRNYGRDSHLSIGPEANGLGPGSNTPKLKEFMDKLGFTFVSQFQLEHKRLYQESPEWDIVFRGVETIDLRNELSPNHRIGIFGGKGVGKSTFSRWLTNKLLQKYPSVLYIDLDPGQTEFTPPGLVSIVKVDEPLLGPNFTHLKEPLMSFFIGTCDICSQPLTYYDSMKKLNDHLIANPSLCNIPWIINTMGFSKGLGVDFGCESIKIFCPNIVVQFHIEDEGRCYPFLLRREEVNSHASWVSSQNPNSNPVPSYPFYLIASVCESKGPAVLKGKKTQWGLTPKQLRENVLVSYFAPKIGSGDLLSIQPMAISLKHIAIGISPNEASFLTYRDQLASVNGNLVALCECPSEYIAVDPEGMKSIIPATHKRQSSLNCLGYGIVRAIDPSISVLFLVTPLPQEKLEQHVNCVISAGAIELPIQFRLGSRDNPGKVGGKELPYVMSTTGESRSKLHTASKRQFVPNRVAHNPSSASRPALKNCFR